MSLLLASLLTIMGVAVFAEQFTVPAMRLKHFLTIRETLAEHYWPSELPREYDGDLAASMCVAQSLHVRYSHEPWSLQMWDASGVTLVGQQSGNHQARGHQEQCLSVHHQVNSSMYESLSKVQNHIVHSALQRLHPLALNSTSPDVRGRYCVVSMRSRLDAAMYSTGSSELLGTLSNHNTPNYATCVPDTCSEHVLQKWFETLEGKNTIVSVKCTKQATILSSSFNEETMMNAVLSTTHYQSPLQYNTNISVADTTKNFFVTVQGVQVTTSTIIFCAFFGILLATVFVATAVDCFYNNNSQTSQHQRHQDLQNERDPTIGGQYRKMQLNAELQFYGWEFLQCFSVPQNWQKIFPRHQPTNAIPVIDGLRCLSMFWVIIVHRYMLMLITSTHPNNVLQHRFNVNYWWLFNAYPSVDIFFTISGFLLATSITKVSIKSVFNIYLLRYLRLAPSAIFTVCAVMTVMGFFGSGPIYDSFYSAIFQEPCQKSYLSSMFFFSNYHHANDMCLGHLWSLSIDWQLSLLAILIIIPLCSRGTFKQRYGLLLLATFASILLPGVFSLINALPPLPSANHLQKSLDFYNRYYINTACRSAPYCIGLLAGRIHLWVKEHPDVLTNSLINIGHAVSVAAVSAVLVAPLQFDASNVFLSAVHNSLAKPFFAVALGFLIITAYHGKGGIFGYLLSRPFVGSLARISYCVYLTSLPTQVWASATGMTVPTEGILQAYMCGGDIICSIVVGTTLTVLVEMPFARILSTVLKRNSRNKKSTGSSSESENNDIATKDNVKHLYKCPIPLGDLEKKPE